MEMEGGNGPAPALTPLSIWSMLCRFNLATIPTVVIKFYLDNRIFYQMKEYLVLSVAMFLCAILEIKLNPDLPLGSLLLTLLGWIVVFLWHRTNEFIYTLLQTFVVVGSWTLSETLFAAAPTQPSSSTLWKSFSSAAVKLMMKANRGGMLSIMINLYALLFADRKPFNCCFTAFHPLFISLSLFLIATGFAHLNSSDPSRFIWSLILTFLAWFGLLDYQTKDIEIFGAFTVNLLHTAYLYALEWFMISASRRRR